MHLLDAPFWVIPLVRDLIIAPKRGKVKYFSKIFLRNDANGDISEVIRTNWPSIEYSEVVMMAEEHIQTELRRGNTTIRIATDFCVKTPEEVDAILSRISALVQPEMNLQERPDNE